MAEIAAQQGQWRPQRGGPIASHPADNSEARDGGKAAFCRHPACPGGLLVRRGQLERTTTTMLISNGPPDNDEKGANKGVYRAYAAIF